jgi:predicted GNAT family acetyltransferase
MKFKTAVMNVKWSGIITILLGLFMLVFGVYAMLSPLVTKHPFTVSMMMSVIILFMGLIALFLGFGAWKGVDEVLMRGELKKLIEYLAKDSGGVALVFDANRIIHVSYVSDADLEGFHKIKIKKRFGKKIDQYIFIEPSKVYRFKGIHRPVFVAFKGYAETVDIEKTFIADLLKKKGVDREAAERELKERLLQEAYQYLLERGVDEEEAQKLAPYYANDARVRERIKDVSIVSEIETDAYEEENENDGTDELEKLLKERFDEKGRVKELLGGDENE